VEDGKLGGKGSDLARAHGNLGGRPRNVKPIRLDVPPEDASEILRAAGAAERESERLAAVARRLRKFAA
jgi:hypothetical protein